MINTLGFQISNQACQQAIIISTYNIGKAQIKVYGISKPFTGCSMTEQCFEHKQTYLYKDVLYKNLLEVQR